MRIAIDADLVGENRSGNEIYTRGMIRGISKCLDPTKDALLLAGSRNSDLEGIATPGIRPEFVLTPPGIRGDLAMGRRMTAARADTCLASYNAPLAFSGTMATVVHDTAYLRVPETFPTALRYRLRLSVSRTCRVSDFVVTVSEFSKSELLHFYPKLTPDRIIVTYDAPSPTFYRSTIPDGMLEEVRTIYQLPEDFVLTVGNIQPRKNLNRLMDAMSRLDIPLVVVGQKLWLTDTVNHRASHAKWLGYVPSEHLPAIYANCTAFAYPSLYEGFGLPVIEAMAAEVPVVTSDGSSLREVAGGAAVLCDPLSVESIRGAVERVLSDSSVAADLVRAGSERARQFTWEDSGRDLVDSLHRSG